MQINTSIFISLFCCTIFFFTLIKMKKKTSSTTDKDKNDNNTSSINYNQFSLKLITMYHCNKSICSIPYLKHASLSIWVYSFICLNSDKIRNSKVCRLAHILQDAGIT